MSPLKLPSCNNPIKAYPPCEIAGCPNVPSETFIEVQCYDPIDSLGIIGKTISFTNGENKYTGTVEYCSWEGEYYLLKVKPETTIS